MKIAIIVAGVLAGLVVLGGGAGAYWVAGNVRVNDTVRAVNKDIDQMNAEADKLASLKSNGPAFPNLGSAASPADFVKLAKQFDASAQQYDANLNQADGFVTDAHQLLSDAQSRVSAASADWLTAPHRSRLDKERRALAYEQQAADTARRLVNVARLQFQAYKAVVDSLSSYAQIPDRLNANDLAGGISDDQSAETNLTNAGQYAQDAHMPSGWDAALGALNRLYADTRDFLQDLQQANQSAAQTKGNAVVADANALEKLDTSSFDKAGYLDALYSQITALEAKSSSALK